MAPSRLSPSSNSSSSSSASTTTTPQSDLSFSFSRSTATTNSSTRRSSSQPPPRARSSVPFSWEAQPGVPKHSPNDHNKDTTNSSTRLQPPPSARTTLRPPPPVRSYSDTFPTLRRRGSVRSQQRTTGAGGAKSVNDPVFVRDPFAVALAECCSAASHQLDEDCHYDASAAVGRKWAPEYYYCSPPRRGLKSESSGSRRWAAEYYCSPQDLPSKSNVSSGNSGGGPIARHLLGSVFGLRSLGLYASCKSASAVADSVAYLPIRPATAGSARVRSAAFPTAKKTSSSSSFSRSDSVGLSRRRHAGFDRVAIATKNR